MSALSDPPLDPEITRLLRQYWGFQELRPLQAQAIEAVRRRRDSLIVLPTGGGKSLCYQLPPLLEQRTDLVVSPLIALMKDQVDALNSIGYPAVALHSGLNTEGRRSAYDRIRSGQCRLIFVSPERLLRPDTSELIERLKILSFAIDEAHCISHWGHDFRPEYRQLSRLKEKFPGSGLHAYTATATERVRQDIIGQLQFSDPLVLTGRFDRPNLIYRVIPRDRLNRQLLQIVERHAGEAGIIYCISRKETERVAAALQERGLRAACYHAGMDAASRRQIQDSFASETLDIVVATVAFGMGIDRSNVRFIVHAGMPKSIEHYQQETGRAGRDGLPAECVLFYSPVDLITWQSLLDRAEAEEEVKRNMQFLLDEMRRYCAPGECRHRVLSNYFGQSYERSGCEACDVCLGESEGLQDSTVEAQMILSAVARVGQRFGIAHVVDVLRGSSGERIQKLNHHRLSTYGLLPQRSVRNLTYLIYQLVDQHLLERTSGDYPVLKLTEKSMDVLRGRRRVWTVPLRSREPVRATKREAASWEGVDRTLFDRLRELRLDIARRRSVPPYVVFSDRSLRDMARRKPSTREQFLRVHGVGERKLADLGDLFIETIRGHSGIGCWVLGVGYWVIGIG